MRTRAAPGRSRAAARPWKRRRVRRRRLGARRALRVEARYTHVVRYDSGQQWTPARAERLRQYRARRAASATFVAVGRRAAGGAAPATWAARTRTRAPRDALPAGEAQTRRRPLLLLDVARRGGREPDALYIHPQHVGLTPMEVAILSRPSSVRTASTMRRLAAAHAAAARRRSRRAAPAAMTHVVLPGGRIRAPPPVKSSPSTRPPPTALPFPLLRSVPYPVRMLALTQQRPRHRQERDGAQVPCAGAQAAHLAPLREDRRPVRSSSSSTHATSSGAAPPTSSLHFCLLNRAIVFAAELGCLAYHRSKRRSATASPNRRRSCARRAIPICSTATSLKPSKRSNSSTAAWSSGTPEPSRPLTKCWRRCPRGSTASAAVRPGHRHRHVPRAVAARGRPRLHRALSVQAHRMKRASLPCSRAPSIRESSKASVLRALERRSQVDAARLRE